MKKTAKASAQENRRRLLEQRRNTRFKILIFILVLAIAAEALYVLSGSRYFHVRAITVYGNRQLTEVRIKKLAGITLKDNFLYINTPFIEKRIKGEPWVSKATVVRTWPLAIKIYVLERRPWAVLAQDGQYLLLDRNAIVIKVLTAAEPGLPLIKDAPREEGLEPGRPATGVAVINSLAVVDALDSDIRADIGWVSAPTIDGLSIKLNSGPIIMYGKSEMNRQKNYAIKVITTEAGKESKVWQYIDVRAPSNPVAKAAA